ncbi:MAG: acyl-CoA dehydrogenase [Candidatus Melainabacteria bacterium GWA2_34_9]|nr:MAG: acyl-CoA dehydrogenase [Candidatus Melainabacteria bacterium GWA2_34_9]
MTNQAVLKELEGSTFQLTEEQRDIKQVVREFAETVIAPRSAEVDETAKFPWDVYKEMAESGLISLPYPEQYGGGGADPVMECILVEELSRVDLSVALACGVNTLGSQPIMLGGNEEQKRKYIPQITSGEKLCAFGLTEAGAGSDFMGIKTRAVKKGDKYIVNGTKLFISHANLSKIVTVFAKTSPEPGLKSLSCFIVDSDAPGFKVGKTEHKLGIRGSETAELIFEDMEIPAENLIGTEGAGWKLAMSTLDHSRPGVGAQGVGVAQGALDFAFKYAQEREQFGQPIGNFEAVQNMLVKMAMDVEAARLLVYKAATLVSSDSREKSMYASLSKCYGGDVAMKVTTDAVQVLGGYGFTKEFPVERMMRDAKITQIYEGTNQVQRMVISRHLLKGYK